jgi:hypothetical protein
MFDSLLYLPHRWANPGYTMKLSDKFRLPKKYLGLLLSYAQPRQSWRSFARYSMLLHRRPGDDSGLFRRLRIEAFYSSRRGAMCHLATNFNGKALSPPISVDEVTKDFTIASFTLAPDAIASSVSALLRCNRFASASVLVSDLRIESWQPLSN